MNCDTALTFVRNPVLAAALAVTASVNTPAAFAQTPESARCTTKGMDWNNHPLFRASLHTSDRNKFFRALNCKVESAHDLQADDVTVRLTLSTLFYDEVGGPKHPIKLVEVSQVEAGKARSINRLFLDADPLDGELVFAPQVRKVDGAIYIRLSPRHRHLYRLEEGKLFESLAFGWRAAIDDAFPDNARNGVNLGIDINRMEGRIAVRSHAGDAGSRNASAYAENPVLTAKLVFRDGKLQAEATKITPRAQGEEPFLDRINEMDETIRAGLKNFPSDVEPCSLGAWSVDTDPAGLNVRAAPSLQAKVLGIVPPPRMMPKEEEAFGPEPAKSEFRVIGHRDGWFLIEKISPPGVVYDVPYARHLPQPYKGRGWVNGRMIGGALANGGLPSGRLYDTPHADAGSTEIVTSHGNHIGAGDPVRRILACSGWWALIETNEGKRGWWRSICSNQVTNCS